MVVDCNATASWVDSMIGTGTLHLRSADRGEPDMHLGGVPDYDAVRKRINSFSSVSQQTRVLGTV
jgi:hypothetical protein